MGVNLNGDLFIGGRDTPREIHKVKCDGTFVEIAISENDNPGLDYNNFVSYDNVLYINGRGDFWVEAYDLCSGDFIGIIDMDGSDNWELMQGSDGLMYTLDERTDDLTIYQIPYDISLYTNPPTTTIAPTINTALSFPGARYTGLAQDENGFWYAGVWPNFAVSGNTPSRIYKLNPDGTIVSFIEDTNLNGTGFAGARGFAYSQKSGKIYVATRDEDCVAVIDAATMTYQPTLSLPGGGGKALKLITECCPPANPTLYDIMLCDKSIGDRVFLNNIFNCDDEGIICESEWSEVSASGFTFDDCELSLTITDANACGVYQISKDNAATATQQCAAYNITINLCVSSIDANISQSACINNGTIDYFTVTVDGSASNATTDGQYAVVLNANADGSGGTILGTSDYGTPITVGDGTNAAIGTFLADGSSTYPITIRDANAKRCNLVVNTTAVNSCAATCAIIPTATALACQDTGTPSDPSDDTFDVNVSATATNSGVSGQFTVSSGVTFLGTFDYATGGTITALPANGNNITLTFADFDDNACSATAQVSQTACSNTPACPPTKCMHVILTKSNCFTQAV